MRILMKPATCRNGILIALILGGLLTACQSEEVTPLKKEALAKARTSNAPPGGNNGGGGGN